MTDARCTGRSRRMSQATPTALTRAEQALASGGWIEARELFEESLAEHDEPRAHDGLGRTMWWLGSPTSPSTIGNGRSRRTRQPARQLGLQRSRSGWRVSTCRFTGTTPWPTDGSPVPGDSSTMGRAAPKGNSTSPWRSAKWIPRSGRNSPIERSRRRRHSAMPTSRLPPSPSWGSRAPAGSGRRWSRSARRGDGCGNGWRGGRARDGRRGMLQPRRAAMWRETQVDWSSGHASSPGSSSAEPTFPCSVSVARATRRCSPPRVDTRKLSGSSSPRRTNCEARGTAPDAWTRRSSSRRSGCGRDGSKRRHLCWTARGLPEAVLPAAELHLARGDASLADRRAAAPAQ